MRDPLNRRNAPGIIRLFDTCFRQGVFDACDAGDDCMVRDFVSRHRSSWTFGTILGADEEDWRSFRFIVYRWARENGNTFIAENYLIMIRKTNYLWCILPFCMWFYLMGAEEWLAYPDPTRIQVFKANKRTHWNQNVKVKAMTRMDFISYMHDACFQYRSLEPEKKLVNDLAMDNYCSAVFDLTRPYAKGGR